MSRLLLVLGLGVGFNSRAQLTNYVLPVVTIKATDPVASWSGHTGVFTVFRTGNAAPALNIYYRIFGTATNGVDYQAIGNWVPIPSGVYSNSIVITPIDLGQTQVRTVGLALTYPPILPPINYLIGSPSNATVYITSSTDTNIPPTVRIVTPRSGTVFNAPANIPICAYADDPDGFVATVEFFAGTQSLGVTTNNPYSAGLRNPFCLVWSNVPPGNYSLTARAVDNGGASTVSDPVNVIVQSAPPPPPTNFPPVVRIMSPPNGALFHAPVNIPIYAYAYDRDGSVASVEFFASGHSLGLGQTLCTRSNWNIPVFCSSNVFALVWSNAPVGPYTLTAKATDNGGASTVSPPVNITIVPAPPPPTNRPPLVSIVASDPLAIEGTNCWPWLGVTNRTPNWTNWTGAPFYRFFTNCGPKNASFVVRRFGDTNDELTVSYSIGGTATNGVDYVPLSGSVTIPSGERRAEITVIPIDDGPPDINTTVVLKLLPGTNYLLGFPSKAAALILDSRWPRPVTDMVPGDSFHLNANGPDAGWFHVEYSTDLLNWSSVCTNQVVNGSIDFIDPDAQDNPARFYRVVPEAGPPGD